MLPVYYILPYPPSDNAKYAARTSKVPSRMYKRYVDEVAALCLTCGVGGIACGEIIKEPVRATVWLYPANTRRDAANCLKILFDALEKNGVIENDKLIKQVEVVTCDVETSDIVIVCFEPVKKGLIEPMPKKIKYLLKHYKHRTFYAAHVAKAIDEGGKAMP